MDALAPGSCLLIGDGIEIEGDDAVRKASEEYAETGAVPYHVRPLADLRSLFDGRGVRRARAGLGDPVAPRSARRTAHRRRGRAGAAGQRLRRPRSQAGAQVGVARRSAGRDRGVAAGRPPEFSYVHPAPGSRAPAQPVSR
ncbi:hypothetical protein [Pseudonocardia lacus]|uniref:hypothetical protein n=1 Tax=Pseudonocardia lacus TaxID=2835865 RepID=UPI0020278695|nr:hypothetical protein [Pseudonocardia lacus]